MNRNQAKEFYPILQAFAEGKTIECRTKPSAVVGTDVPNEWQETKEIGFWCDIEYRIKPYSKAEAKYRPFKDAEECWTEMQKHQPFGWVLNNSNGRAYNIQSVLLKDGCVYIRSSYVELGRALIEYTFADGTPFGIKEEEQLWLEIVNFAN